MLAAADEDWQHTFTDVLLATVHGCRAAVPFLVETGGGAIVTTAAYSVRAPKPHQVPYATLKAGVATLTKTIAKWFGLQGVRADWRVPGSDGNRDPRVDALSGTHAIVAGPKEVALERAMGQDWGMHVVLGRIGKPNEVGD